MDTNKHELFAVPSVIPSVAEGSERSIAVRSLGYARDDWMRVFYSCLFVSIRESFAKTPKSRRFSHLFTELPGA
jgi:hypothetical protein